MKQLVGFTADGTKVIIVDFVLNSNTEETFAICLCSFGDLVQLRINSLNQVHYEIV